MSAIVVFENCPKRTPDELKLYYGFNITKYFENPKALELLQCYAREYSNGSLTHQYLELHEQIEDILNDKEKCSAFTQDDIDDLEGLPSSLERQLRDVVANKHMDAQRGDQLLREYLRKIQDTLCNDIETRREFQIFKIGIKKALKPYHCL